MPTTNSPKQDVIPVRVTPVMRRQVDELTAAGFGNQTEVIRTAVDRMHQREVARTMYAVEKTDADTLETTGVGKFKNEADAIKAAQSEAAEVDQNVISIAVYNPQGDVIWDNDGDWRNAV